MLNKKLISLLIKASMIGAIFGVLLGSYYLNNKNMADPVWGLLPKAQDDPETIEEAIVRLIGEHEADSGAHTGSGESLETHKTQDALDHKAGSVFADKESMTEFIIKDDFKSLNGWITLGTVDNGDWPGTKLYVEWGAVNESHMAVQSTMPAQFFDTDFDMLYQITARFDLGLDLYEAWLGMAINKILPVDGIGFVFEDGETKAIFAISSTRVFSSVITNDQTIDHVYRAQYEALTGDAHYYIDGVLVATLSKPAGHGSIDAGAGQGIKLTQNNDGNLFIGGVTMARGI